MIATRTAVMPKLRMESGALFKGEAVSFEGGVRGWR
jgi:hypothetical protein